MATSSLSISYAEMGPRGSTIWCPIFCVIVAGCAAGSYLGREAEQEADGGDPAASSDSVADSRRTAINDTEQIATDTGDAFPWELDGSIADFHSCAEQALSMAYVPAKLMIALDMSGSMADGDRYTEAALAIQEMLNRFGGRFRFGFDTYPDIFESASCHVSDPVLFDSDFGNEGDIIAWLDLNTPWKGTGDPLLLEMKQFLEVEDYAPDFFGEEVAGEAYLLVVSDGGDSCGENGVYDASLDWVDELASTTASLLARGIHTIPIGYSESADADALDRIAAAGGTAYDRHIPASDREALVRALVDIGDDVFSCGFEIADPGPNADHRKINLYMNDEVIPFDESCTHHTGWTWDDDAFRRIRLCGDACNALRADDDAVVVALFGCPAVLV